MSETNFQAKGDSEGSKYKWYVLTLAALTHTFSVAMPTMSISVLFKEISEDLGLSLVQIGTVWGAAALTGIFTGLLGGSIGDRYGIKRTLTVTCLLAGIAGALRGFSNSFMSLMITVLLSGLVFPAIPTNVHKTCGIWFSKQRLGFANGVVSMGMALGFMGASMISATVLSPLLGGWRNVLFFYGALSAAISIPWYFVRDAPGEGASTAEDTEQLSLRQGMSQVIHLKNIWLLGFAMLGLGGCIQGTLGFLPLYLRQIGWSGATADNALAAFHAASMISVIPLALLSDRLGSRKVVLGMATLMITIGVGLLSVVDGTLVWVSVIMAGIFRDGFMAIFMTTVIELDGVGPALAGTAVGLVMIFSSIGSLLSPPLGNSLAEIHLSLPFLFWASMSAVAFLIFWRSNVGGRKLIAVPAHKA